MSVIDKIRKHKRLTIAIVVFVIVIITVVISLVALKQNANQNADQPDIRNVNVAVNMNENMAHGDSSSTDSNTGNANASQSFGNNSSNSSSKASDNAISENDRSQDRGLSQEAKTAQARNDTIDKEQANSVGEKFALAFLEYDSTSIGDGSYKNNFMQYVNSGAARTGLLSQHMDSKWLAACATYPEYHSHIVSHSIDGDPIYSATSSGLILVTFKARIEANIGNPGEFVDWQQVNRYDITYGVYLTPNDYKVVDIKKQESKLVDSNINNWQSQEHGSV